MNNENIIVFHRQTGDIEYIAKTDIGRYEEFTADPLEVVGATIEELKRKVSEGLIKAQHEGKHPLKPVIDASKRLKEAMDRTLNKEGVLSGR